MFVLTGMSCVHIVLSMDSIKFGDRNSGSQVGINNGVINLGAGESITALAIYARSTDSDLLLEQLEPRPDPLSTVPALHDPDFVSRDDLLNHIHEKSSVPGSRIVLVGLGGVG
jgi:hypothetical protein